MKSNTSWRIRLNEILLGAAIVIALVVVRGAAAGDEPVHEHLVTDWSHRHVIYSTPKSLMRRFELSQEHRYVQQWRRRESERHNDRHEWRWHRAPEPAQQFQGDWSMNMGPGANVGAGNYPAKFSFDTTSALCATAAQPDFVVYNTSQPGSGTQASIVAFDNLYSSCLGGTPLTYWAYNTGGTAATSPVLSIDGSQVAFIQNNGGVGSLVVLRWRANDGTLSLPSVPTPGACTALTAPCQQTVPFSTVNGRATPNTSDSFSSPFYDYPTDTLYVGDGDGVLHKFTPVFSGTPTEVVSSVTNIWPAPLDPFGHLSSPVYVNTVHQVLVTDSNGDIYSVDAITGGDCFNPCTGISPSTTGANFLDPKLASPGFDDGPIVDVTTGRVYVFARASSEFFPPMTNIPPAPNGAPSVFVLDIPANPAAIHIAPVHQVILSDAISPAAPTIPATPYFIGGFDNQYYITGGTGYLYACGTTAGGLTALWQIHVDGSTVDPPFLGPTLTTANTGCSPITEFFNGTTDRMFLSVTGSAQTAAPISCPTNTGCVMSFSTDPVAFSPTSAPIARAPEAGGTSGIVIDNSSAAGGASQVYFTPLADQSCTTTGGTGGCAIQASQAGLL